MFDAISDYCGDRCKPTEVQGSGSGGAQGMEEQPKCTAEPFAEEDQETNARAQEKAQDVPKQSPLRSSVCGISLYYISVCLHGLFFKHHVFLPRCLNA